MFIRLRQLDNDRKLWRSGCLIRRIFVCSGFGVFCILCCCCWCIPHNALLVSYKCFDICRLEFLLGPMCVP